MSFPIDRTRPPFKEDPVISRLSDEHVWALAGLVARLAASYARAEVERSRVPTSESDERAS